MQEILSEGKNIFRCFYGQENILSLSIYCLHALPYWGVKGHWIGWLHLSAVDLLNTFSSLSQEKITHSHFWIF